MTFPEIKFIGLNETELDELYRESIRTPEDMDLYLLAFIKIQEPKELIKRLAEGEFPMNTYLDNLCRKIKNSNFILYKSALSQKEFLLNYDELSSLLTYLQPLKINL